ncbi:HAD hydrolase-like protein, partial [Staphylococcus aureus]
LRHFDAGADSAIMVGDSRVDVQAGKAAGTKTVGVSYGFEGVAIAHSEPDFIASTVEELNAVLCDWMQAVR